MNKPRRLAPEEGQPINMALEIEMAYVWLEESECMNQINIKAKKAAETVTGSVTRCKKR
ncbi:hypothetical protein B14911_09982 [Bacillus sp. NRRL B-14911]|uniref:Uncharacterized protein n=1 Tax=Bacillus infantis NRRL B-14911 TaxID=1367477 RepID=U5LBT0_9BACI|nr:hypothetical protein N288_10720 [Bacillus infantis NRRL B-14911]EAR65895.1 hypothetical protein B14911_09982 [Bacillus sp. NRRL B-14911]